MKYFYLLLIFLSINAHAKLSIITTTSNLADVVRQIGGNKVVVESLCKGVQDPHFLEAKPSYTFKLSKADLLVSVGGGLEVGWLPLVIRGSQNPDLREGESHHLVAADLVTLIEQTAGRVSRAQGDVHPEGNPHFMLGPSYSLKVARGVADKLVQIDSKNETFYKKNFKAYEQKILKSLELWKKKIPDKLKVISYHRTLSYFYNEFGIENVDVLEPKPGVPPSASHIISLIAKMKNQNIKKIIIENYFDDSVARKIKKDIPEAQIEVVPVGVNGRKGVEDIFELYDYLVQKMGA